MLRGEVRLLTDAVRRRTRRLGVLLVAMVPLDWLLLATTAAPPVVLSATRLQALGIPSNKRHTTPARSVQVLLSAL